MKTKTSWKLRGVGIVLGIALAQGAAGAPRDTVTTSSSSTGSSESWKGEPEKNGFEVGGLAGLGVIDSHGGFALLGTAAAKILPHGFFPDINNSASLEVEAGPLFVDGTAAVQYSLHLRWDFKKDDIWTFYALGGIGGDITGDSLGNRFLIFPRLGIGAMLDLGHDFLLRAELSHELIAIGFTLPLF